MSEYLIKIKGTQGLDEDTDTIEFSTFGAMNFEDDQIVLSYGEGEMIGVKNVQTKLKVNGDKSVIMERTGEISSRLVIEKGIRNNCFYSTPHGDLVIGIFGEKIENELNADGGRLLMSYNLDTNLQPISKNTVEIEVRKAK